MGARIWGTLALAGLLMSGAARAQEHVTIGFTGPLSGGAALYGKNTLTGLQDAADEINAAGGLAVGGAKYLLDVVALDDKYSPSEAAVNAKRLRAQYKAPVVFVPHAGGVLALQAFNEQDGFLIGAYTSTPAVTEHGNGLTLRWSLPALMRLTVPELTPNQWTTSLGRQPSTNSAHLMCAALICPGEYVGSFMRSS